MREPFNDLLSTVFVLAIFPLLMSDAVNAEAVSFAPAGPAATPGAVIPKAIPAKLSLPSGATGRVPVVVIAHAGSGLTAEGPEPGYVAALNAAGIATLTIDMWTPRGVPSGPAAIGGNGGADRRPTSVRDTLPDAFGALKYLAGHPAIDPQRIGIMGFSWGAMLGDIEDGYDEEALAAMHDWWNYNHEVICTRGNYVAGGYGRSPASPRIDLTVFLTRKDNLVVEWCPSGMEFGRLTPKCDWARWRAETNRHVNWDSRPSNELLFIHEVGRAAPEFTGRYMYDPKTDTPERTMIHAILLQAVAAMVEEPKGSPRAKFCSPHGHKHFHGVGEDRRQELAWRQSRRSQELED